MKRRILCLLALCFFALSNTVSAKNWVQVCNSPDNLQTFYVDRDSSVKSDDTVIFWELVVIYESNPSGVNKIIYNMS